MEDKINMPLLGDAFPEMEVKTTQGMMKLPDEMAGNWFVLFSHPADFTPVCTTEFVGFQKRMEQFKAMDCKLVGLSIDQVFSHIKWIEWIKDNLDVDIEFPIIAANDSIANKLGLLHPGKGASTVRAVFVVDPKGKVRLILYYPQEIGRNMDEIVRSVKALQLSDTKGIAVPANWPNNELIGDRVIVPPASDMKAVKARKEDKSLECFDWWFCYKENK
ncbi:MAG: peroxiredoxin [Candidatus Cloacimonetes bacterium]|nr:peroxiredoxin [Candidatus Cloacimonadota bacterium]